MSVREFDRMIAASLRPIAFKWLCFADTAAAAAGDDAGGGGGAGAGAAAGGDSGDGGSTGAGDGKGAAAAADADKGAGATSGDGGELEAGNVIWPEKWREEIAGADDKDAKRLTRLGRFDQPGKIFDSFLEIEQTLRKADIRSPFPEEGNDKDKAKWRKGNGVPDEAAGYFEKLPDGLVIGEEDKQGMDTLAEAMHAKHAPAEMAHVAMGAYYKHVENLLAERAAEDVKEKKDTDDALHELYGVDFRRNINDLNAWLDSAGEDVKAKIFGARMPNGTPVGNDPDVLKWLIGQMRTINPLVTVPGLGGGDPALALNDEIAAIEKVIQTDNRAYRADKVMQARYLELIAARDSKKASGKPQ